MDKLQARAIAFSNLLDVEYRIILGRKGKTFEITLGFEPFDFPHLIGLHKLSDIFHGHISNDLMFNKCLSGEITYSRISQSSKFYLLGNRFECFDQLELLLDSNDTVFKCNARALKLFSQIEADYQIKSVHKLSVFYLFLQQRRNSNSFFCKSFINDNVVDYTYGQTKMTLLYKEKTNKLTGETVVQFDRLKK